MDVDVILLDGAQTSHHAILGLGKVAEKSEREMLLS